MRRAVVNVSSGRYEQGGIRLYTAVGDSTPVRDPANSSLKSPRSLACSCKKSHMHSKRTPFWKHRKKPIFCFGAMLP